MSAAIETMGAGRRYGDFWALRQCTLSLSAGSITAVVGPNGAGKTTLLNLLVGLQPASEGQLRVVGEQPSSKPEFLARVGFLAQDCPLYKEFSVADLLRFGRAMNPSWDDALARERLAAAEVPLQRHAGKLSGGPAGTGGVGAGSGETTAGAAVGRTVSGAGPAGPARVPQDPVGHRERGRHHRRVVLTPDR